MSLPTDSATRLYISCLYMLSLYFRSFRSYSRLSFVKSWRISISGRWKHRRKNVTSIVIHFAGSFHLSFSVQKLFKNFMLVLWCRGVYRGGMDAACVQFASGGKEFCRQGGKCPERLRYMRGGGKGDCVHHLRGIDAPATVKIFFQFLGANLTPKNFFANIQTPKGTSLRKSASIEA
jgi:hypothetical protein